MRAAIVLTCLARAATPVLARPELNPERGGYFRSDHFMFAKPGVSMLDGRSGEDVALYYQLDRELADGVKWPDWYRTAEFRAIRDRDHPGARTAQ